MKLFCVAMCALVTRKRRLAKVQMTASYVFACSPSEAASLAKQAWLRGSGPSGDEIHTSVIEVPHHRLADHVNGPKALLPANIAYLSTAN
jgi:hypothetical protein